MAAVQAVQMAADGWGGVPWVIWSGVISAVVASVVAGATLWVSSWNSLRLLRKQQQHDDAKSQQQRIHDAKLKRDDRKGTIRREVYLEAVEQAHALLAAIGGLTQRNTDTSSDADAFQAFLKANAKVWLVAEPDAAHLSRDLAAQFALLHLHAVQGSLPVRYAMEPVRSTEKAIEREEEEALRLQRLYNDARAKKASHETQAHLAALLDEAHAWIDVLKRRRDEQRAQVTPLMFEAFAESFGEQRAVQRTLWRLVCMLRGELHLPADLEHFMDQLRATEHLAWAAINNACGIVPPAAMPDPIEIAPLSVGAEPRPREASTGAP